MRVKVNPHPNPEIDSELIGEWTRRTPMGKEYEKKVVIVSLEPFSSRPVQWGYKYRKITDGLFQTQRIILKMSGEVFDQDLDRKVGVRRWVEVGWNRVQDDSPHCRITEG